MARILVIDDEKHIRDLYLLELGDMGHEVTTLSSCHELMGRVELAKPDVVVLDIRLVDCDGLEVLGEIRRQHPDLPVVLSSAYDSYQHDTRSMNADYYVVKSFDLSELKRKIERALEGNLPKGPYEPPAKTADRVVRPPNG